MLRRIYNLIAVFALLNMLVLGGAAGYLVSKGYLTSDKLRRIGQVVRGEDEQEPEAAEKQPEADAPAEASPAQSELTSVPIDLSKESQYAQEIVFHEMQRFKDEMDQRMALNNKIMLMITTRREALERDIKAFQQRRQQDVEIVDNEAFKKELEIFESLKPVTAMERLVAKSNVEDAAKLMLQMDSRKVAKIIEAAKTPADKLKLQAVQERMREVTPEESDKTTDSE